MDLEIWDGSGESMICKSFEYCGEDVTDGLGNEFFEFRDFNSARFSHGNFIVSVYFAACPDPSIARVQATVAVTKADGTTETRTRSIDFEPGRDQWHAFRIDAATGAITDIDRIVQTFQRDSQLSEQPSRVETLADADSAFRAGNKAYEAGDFETALLLWQQELEIRNQLQGESHQAVASVFNNLGVVHMAREEYGLARENFERCLSIRLEFLGEYHADVASIYDNLGLVCESEGDFFAALGWQARSLLVTRMLQDRMMTRIDTTHVTQDLWSDTVVVPTAEFILHGVFGSQHPVMVARWYRNEGNIHLGEAQFNEARGDLGQALNVLEQVGETTGHRVNEVKALLAEACLGLSTEGAVLRHYQDRIYNDHGISLSRTPSNEEMRDQFFYGQNAIEIARELLAQKSLGSEPFARTLLAVARLANSCETSGIVVDAIRAAYENLLRTGTRDGRLFSNVCVELGNHLRWGDQTEAERIADQAEEAVASDTILGRKARAICRLRICELYLNMECRSKGIGLARRLIQSDTSDPYFPPMLRAEAAFLAAGAFWAMGDSRAAILAEADEYDLLTSVPWPKPNPEIFEMYRAQLLGNLPRKLASIGEHARAVSMLEEQVARESTSSDDINSIGTLLEMTAQVHASAGEYERAAHCLDEAVDIYLARRWGDTHPQVLEDRLALGDAQERLGRIPEAIRVYREIVRYPFDSYWGSILSIGDAQIAWAIAAWRLSVLLKMDSASNPTAHLEESCRAARSATVVWARAYRRSAGFVERGDERLERVTEIAAWQLDREFEARTASADTWILLASELSHGLEFLRAVAFARRDFTQALPPELAKEERRLTDAFNSDETENVVRSLDETVRKREALDAFIDRLHIEHPGYAAIQYPRPATLEQARATLAPDEVAIEYVLGKYGAFLVAVTKDSFAFHSLGSESEVKACIAAADSDISGRTRGARFNTAAIGPTEELYRLLLGPVESMIRGKRLIIVPSGELEAIAFEALRTPSGKFLVDEHAVEYAPSLAILALTRQWAKENPAESRRLLALGDPVYDRADSQATLRAASYSDTTRAGWTRLPGTESEVRAIEELFPFTESRVFMQSQATEENVERENWRDYGYLHFACHGALEAGRGRQPALVLSQVGNQEPYDGFLTLSEVISRPHRARLSVLSACNSGRAGATQARTGVSSLARAFLLTGSDAVIVSLWPVDDEATARLMSLLYKGMREDNLRPGEALRRAQAALRADPQHPEWQQPAYWAPFICVGE